MNKRGFGPIGFLFMILVFILIWWIWLGGWISEVGQDAVQVNGYTGFEAFFYSNLNMLIFIALILGILGYFYFGGGS